MTLSDGVVFGHVKGTYNNHVYLLVRKMYVKRKVDQFYKTCNYFCCNMILLAYR